MKCGICKTSNAALALDGRYLCKSDAERLGYMFCSECGKHFPREMEHEFKTSFCKECCDKRE